MTERLYYTDCYLREFTALVTDSAEDGRRLYLDRTSFYPTSGGQPNDVGTIAGRRVLDVVDEGERIAHITAEPVQEDAVECSIDWTRRFDHMQQHTGQHLLSAVWHELFGIPTLSFHMGTETSSVELGVKAFSDSQIDDVERRVNEIVLENRPVTISFDDSELVEGLRKASQRQGTLRIVTIAGIDRSACGGTHLRSTAEIGPLQIRAAEKIRGNTRIEFVCGFRALRRMKQDYRLLAELSRISAASLDELPASVAALRKRLVEAEKQRQSLMAELARLEGLSLHAQAKPSADGIRRIHLEVPILDDAIRAKAQSYVNQGKAIVLITAADPAGVLIACSPDSGFNAGAILKTALSRAGARGGGSANLAQGNLPDASLIPHIAADLGFTEDLLAGS